MSQFYRSQTEEFSLIWGKVNLLFYSVLQLIRGGLPALGRIICFTQSADRNVNLIQNQPHRNTQNNV